MNDYDLTAKLLTNALRKRMPIVTWSVLSYREVELSSFYGGEIKVTPLSLTHNTFYITGTVKMGPSTDKFKQKQEVSGEVLFDSVTLAVEMLVRKFARDLGDAMLEWRPKEGGKNGQVERNSILDRPDREECY